MFSVCFEKMFFWKNSSSIFSYKSSNWLEIINVFFFYYNILDYQKHHKRNYMKIADKIHNVNLIHNVYYKIPPL